MLAATPGEILLVIFPAFLPFAPLVNRIP